MELRVSGRQRDQAQTEDEGVSSGRVVFDPAMLLEDLEGREALLGHGHVVGDGHVGANLERQSVARHDVIRGRQLGRQPRLMLGWQLWRLRARTLRTAIRVRV